MSFNREDPVTVLKGVGGKSAEYFHNAGIDTIGDLTEYYPARYEVYEQPGTLSGKADGQIVAVCGFLEKTPGVRRTGRTSITTARIRFRDTQVEETLQALWFNMPYLRGSVKTGKVYVFRGRLRRNGKSVSLLQPQLFDPEEYEAKCAALQPVYPPVKGLTNNALRKAIRQALEGLSGDREEKDYLPKEILERYELARISYVGWQMHFPENEFSMQSARKRLVFEEFLFFLLTVRMIREEMAQVICPHSLHVCVQEQMLLDALPYQLTGAQRRAWSSIRAELTGSHVMTRLVQGDVGSGKTVIAFLAMITAAGNGKQAALMVPTEVLARQHYASFTGICKKAGIECPSVLLTGSLSVKEKREARAAAATGKALVIIGTHALIQEGVEFKNLAVVVTDEQHRFGVRQREHLLEKGELPHTLVMSATPIPRTLAAILFGDMDITVIDEMPGGRLPIRNCVVGKAWRPNAYSFIRGEVRKGHQAYVICPLVDASELVDAENVHDYAQMLQNALGREIRTGILHGRMKNAEKNAVMEAFANREIDVLVSTTVVEVGVNVPNATVMMIENAERFGLAQLHQLRGRVGRGADQSYCIFLCTQETKENKERLEILERSNDGFEVARKDLGMRGPGDLLGVRQSGEAQFRVADIYRDAAVLQMADEAAKELYDAIITNKEPQMGRLRTKLLYYQGDDLKNLNI